MSERFSDEVLQEAIHAWHSAPGNASLAAMRAVLEGHLAERCDNELTRKVDGNMTDYVCGLPRDHEGSCQWRQVASDGSPQ